MVRTPLAPNCPSSDRKPPLQRVWVDDARAHLNLPVRGPEGGPRNVLFSTTALPEKVPVMFECGPKDGNEPAYLVGISAAASATVAIGTQPAVNAMVRNISSSRASTTKEQLTESRRLADRRCDIMRCRRCGQGPALHIRWEPLHSFDGKHRGGWLPASWVGYAEHTVHRLRTEICCADPSSAAHGTTVP
jgi:hypothetical protein